MLRRKSFGEESVVEGIAMSIEGLTGTRPAAQTVRKYLQIDAQIGNKARKLRRYGKAEGFKRENKPFTATFKS
jgi:hypothetical protein